MALPPKTPPRFVPTLTEVVQVPDAASPAPGATNPAARTTVLSPSQSAALAKAAPPAMRPPPMQPGSAPVAGARPVAPPLVAPPPVVSPQASRAAASSAQQGPSTFAAATSVGMPPVSAPVAARALPEGMEEYMVHRVMQRVDVVLDQRLREAIATVVQEQTRSVLPRLREEIESVVRHAVYEAVADELASGAPPPPKG